MKKRWLAGLLALVLLCMAGCSKGPAEEGTGAYIDENGVKYVDSLTVAITKDENTLTPFTYVSATGLVVNRLIYDTLFTMDLENNIIPWMVEEDFEVVDSREFTFTLKEGLQFHNGNAVTAEDVKFSFEYPATQKVSGQRKACNQIESIEVLDERTVKFTLQESNVNFMRDGFAYIRIIDDAMYAGVEDGATVTEAVGSGMYKLVEYKTGEYYKLEAVENYFAGEARVKRINMPIMTDATAIQQALLADQLAASTGSIGMEMVETFEAQKDMEVFANAGYVPLILNINNGRAPFDQVAFRKALSYAVDVEGICRLLYGDYALVGTKGLVRGDLPYAVDGLQYEYNTEKAIQLLENLGYTTVNKDGVRTDAAGNALAFEVITYSGNAVRSRACELLQEQLKQVGIQLAIRTLDMDTADAYVWPDFDVAKGRDYDMATWGWSSTDTMTYLISLCSSDAEQGPYNVCGYVSEAFDTLVSEKLANVRTEEEMHDLLRELQAVAADEVPLLTIGYPDTMQACNVAMYDGWQAGRGANVVNIFSFLAE